MDSKIMKYVPKSKAEAISKVWTDEDGMWITLKEGWEAGRMGGGVHVIHEETIRELRYQIAGIERVE